MIQIKIHKNNQALLIVIIPYSPDLVEKIRQIKGRKWDSKNKYWTIPNDEEAKNPLDNLGGLDQEGIRRGVKNGKW